MYQKVLVPLDGSRESWNVIGSIQDVLDPQTEVILLRAIPPMSGQRVGQVVITANEREEAERAREMVFLRDIVHHFGAQSDRFRCKVVISKSVAEGIMSLAAQEGVDLIAMYTHDRKGLARLIKGSIAAKVERRSPTEVRVFRPRELAEVGAWARSGSSGRRPSMTTTHCSHQWIIKTRGPVSIGTCRLCGLEKEFSNSGEDRVNRALLSREARDRRKK